MSEITPPLSNESEGQDLPAAFLAALELRHLAECEAILAQCYAVAQRQPTYAPWCAYFEGILANERDQDWAKAERIFSRLVTTPLDPSLHGRALLALARTYDLQGRWKEVIQTCQQALALFTELNQPLSQAKAWKQMALAYYGGFTQGDFGPAVLSQAITYCQLALHALDTVTGADIAWLKGSLWNALGFIHVSLSQWDKAIACYQQDLTICQTLGDHHGMGLTYGNLGEVYQKRGNQSQALAAYQQALIIIREFDNRYDEIEALANLSFLYQEMKQFELALAHYQQAIQLIETLRTGVSSEAARAGFFATVVDIYANMALLCLAAGDIARAFDVVEQARSRAFLDLLAERSPELSELTEARPMTLAEVQAALPADTLLLEYFTTGLVEAPGDQSASTLPAGRHRFPPARILIFVVSRDQVQVFDANLSPNDLRPRRLDSVVQQRFLDFNRRRLLYDKLIAPAEKLLHGKRRLYLAPHGPLHYIPFQALAAGDGDTLLREAGPQVVYTPSATLLFRPQLKRHARAPGVLARESNGDGKSRLSLGFARCYSSPWGQFWGYTF